MKLLSLLKEIRVTGPNPLKKLALLEPDVEVFAKFKLKDNNGLNNYREYTVQGRINTIRRLSTGSYLVSIIGPRTDYYIEIPSTYDDYIKAHHNAKSGNYIGKLAFGSKFLDNFKIINNLDEIQVKPNLILSFKDINVYMGTYKGNGSEKMNEIMRPDQVANFYNLGSYVTFPPTGNLSKEGIMLMRKHWFDLQIDYNPWGRSSIDTRLKDLKWLEKAIKNNIYTIL